MITLYSYPGLFGVADNNGYGLKVFTFLRLNGMPFKHEHVFDASAAPRGQLPYIVDDGGYAPDAAYARGLADLKVLADFIPAKGYVQEETPTSIDTATSGT